MSVFCQLAFTANFTKSIEVQKQRLTSDVCKKCHKNAMTVLFILFSILQTDHKRNRIDQIFLSAR